jgi:hypothetical protein
MIVWDEPGMIVQSINGATTVGGSPNLNLGGVVLQLESGHSPDVCMFENSFGYRQADIAYISPQGNIVVDFYRITDLEAGMVQVTNGYRSPAPDLMFRYPRIACPSSLIGDQEEFTVVAEDTDGSSTWYIKGFNSSICCNPQFNLTIYNDGSTGNSPFNLTDFANTAPVVAYDRNYFFIWVGWTFDNSAGLLPAPGAVKAISPLVIITDRQAQTLAAQDYLYVPTNIFMNNIYSKLSIAGRYSTNNLLTYLNGQTNSIYTKSYIQNPLPVNLRQSSTTDVLSWLQEASLSDREYFTYRMMVYDLSGRKIATLNGTAGELILQVDDLYRGENAVHLATLLSADGNEHFSGKLSLVR